MQIRKSVSSPRRCEYVQFAQFYVQTVLHQAWICIDIYANA